MHRGAHISRPVLAKTGANCLEDLQVSAAPDFGALVSPTARQ
jgi:hypothetical protein